MMKALIGDRQAVRAGVSVPVRPGAEAAGSEVPPIISFADMPRRVSVRIVTTLVVAREDVPMVGTDLSTVEYGGHAIVALCGELDVTDARVLPQCSRVFWPTARTSSSTWRAWNSSTAAACGH
jgi:hypothetical protein